MANDNISSMTGYGRAEGLPASDSVAAFQLVAECRSVNSRFLEVNIRLPQPYAEYEREFRQLASAKFSRGRIDLVISRKALVRPADSLKASESANASEFKKAADPDKIRQRLSEAEKFFFSVGVTLQDSHKVDLVNRFLAESCADSENPADQSEIKEALLIADKALAQLKQQRQTEGKSLCAEILNRIDAVKTISGIIEKELVNHTDFLKTRLQDRLSRVLNDSSQLDPARLVQEVALLVDRSDVTEELSRLNVHLSAFEQAMQQGGVVGKRFDFLCQEIFRELNTLGTKAGVARIQSLVVDCKVDLERIREQVQNIE